MFVVYLNAKFLAEGLQEMPHVLHPRGMDILLDLLNPFCQFSSRQNQKRPDEEKRDGNANPGKDGPKPLPGGEEGV